MTTRRGTPICDGSAAVHEAFTEHQPERVKAHLRDCASCASEWRSLECAAAAARRSKPLVLSAAEKDELRGKVLVGARAIAQESPPPRAPRRMLGLWVGLGLLLAGVAAVVGTRLGWSGTAATTQRPEVPVHRGKIRDHHDARFAIVSPQPDEKLRLYEGTITLEVSPLQRRERFRVITADSEVEVHGTSFTVSAHHDRLLRVTVERGRVEVRGRGGADHILTPGEVWPRHDPTVSALVEQAPVPTTSARAMETPIASRAGRGSGLRGENETRERPRSTREPSASSAIKAEPKPVAHRGPSEDELAFQEGWAALRNGDPLAASRLFAAVPRATSLGQDAAFWRGVALARAGRATEAVPALERFLAAFPASPHRDEALVTLGSLLRSMGQDAAAAEKLREAQGSPRSDVRERARRELMELP